MKNSFDTIWYLIVGIIYFFLSRAKNSTSEQEAAPNTPPNYHPTPSPYTDAANRQARHTTEVQKVPYIRESLVEPMTMQKPLLHKRNTTIESVRQRLSKEQRVSYVLRRYSHWQRAMIMGELLQRYD